jgi:peptide deformylase
MPKTLKIINLGHPTLRAKAKDVSIKDLRSKKIQGFIDNLLYTCAEKKGMGIAATQVNVRKNIFIVASKPNIRYPKAPTMKPTAIINPKILHASEEFIKGWEGCLSLPGLRGLVPRHTSIKVSYMDRTGKNHVKKFSDFIARIFQHEHDHLNGVMFIDRVMNPKDFISETEYLKMFVGKPKKK